MSELFVSNEDGYIINLKPNHFGPVMTHVLYDESLVCAACHNGETKAECPQCYGSGWYLSNVAHELVRFLDAIGVSRAQTRVTRTDDQLDDEEDRFVQKLWVDQTPPPWYEQAEVLAKINKSIVKDVPSDDEETTR